MLYSDPRRNLAAPPRCSPDTRPGRESVYPENNGEVMPKLHLRSEQNMETNTSTHPQAVQKMWTIENRYSHKDIQRFAYLQLYLFRTGDA
jgi:hypothetical protein